MWDAWRPLENDCEMKLVTFDEEDGKHVFWHSSAHVLGQVCGSKRFLGCLQLTPRTQALELEFGARLCIGPALEEGFYYDLASDSPVSSDDFGRIETRVNKIIGEKQPFERLAVPKEVALEMFKVRRRRLSLFVVGSDCMCVSLSLCVCARAVQQVQDRDHLVQGARRRALHGVPLRPAD